MTADNPKEPKLESTLSKGLAVLECLAASPTARGVTDLSKTLGMTKSNTFRLLQTLSALGYVKNNADKSYQATLKTWQIGRALVDNLNLRALAAPEMTFLSQSTGETVYLAVAEGLSVVYIDKLDSAKPIRSWNPVGGMAPLHCVGTGKAIVARNYTSLRNLLTGNLTKYTELSLTTIAALDKDVAQTLAQGYAYDRGEFREQVIGFGAAITLPQGEAIAAIGVSLPEINLPEGGAAAFGALVAKAAARISAKLEHA
jgi:IclR family transcriptional regulator, KDG regulon repressor